LTLNFSDVSAVTEAFLELTLPLCEMSLRREVRCHRRGSTGRSLVSVHDALTFLSDLDRLSEPPCFLVTRPMIVVSSQLVTGQRALFQSVSKTNLCSAKAKQRRFFSFECRRLCYRASKSLFMSGFSTKCIQFIC